MDFVERLKQYAVDYAVDQDKTEILALQSREQDAVGTLEQIARTFDLALESAREKAESGGQTVHSLRKGNEIDLSNREYAMFREKIAEIKIEKNPQFQNAPDGSYIFDIENKLVYTDGDWEDPTIRRVVSFDLTDGTDLAMAKLFFTEQETEGLDYERIQTILSGVFGEACTSVNYGKGRGAASRQNRRGEGRNRAEAGGGDRENLSSKGKRKYALRKSVEQIEDLVAVHNTTADKLKKTLDLGGFPMPSIAVTKTGIVHSNFGEITLVFGRETVDPKADKRNKALLDDTREMPVNLYEAKPQRAVGFDEIKAAIVPNDMDASLMARLSKVTGQILTYPAGDDAERMRLRDSVEGVRFSL